MLAQTAQQGESCHERCHHQQGKDGKADWGTHESASLSPTYIQKELDLYAASTVYRWIQGKTLPGINRLYQLYKLFGVDIGDILVLEKPAVLKNGKAGDKQEQTVPDQSGNH